ncbi:hypothetical protein QHH03_28695, partial [Aphanizomenon sp. 202]|nr:hypothetical protein [Aphanizomenon sp. 202]
MSSSGYGISVVVSGASVVSALASLELSETAELEVELEETAALEVELEELALAPWSSSLAAVKNLSGGGWAEEEELSGGEELGGSAVVELMAA